MVFHVFLPSSETPNLRMVCKTSERVYQVKACARILKESFTVYHYRGSVRSEALSLSPFGPPTPASHAYGAVRCVQGMDWFKTTRAMDSLGQSRFASQSMLAQREKSAKKGAILGGFGRSS
jgi:hypothetical protein